MNEGLTYKPLNTEGSETAVEQIRSSLAETYEEKLRKALSAYETAGIHDPRPGYERTLSPEAAQTVQQLDARATRATAQFRAVLDDYQASHAKSVEPAPVEQPTKRAPSSEATPLPPIQEEEVHVLAEEEPLDLKWNMREDEEYLAIKSKIETRRPDKIDYQVDLEARRELERLHPEKFKAYAKLEQSTIYRDLGGNPRLALDYTFNQMFLSRDLGGLGYTHSDPHDVHRAYENIVRNYPEKARMYAESDPKLAHLIEVEASKKK